MTTRYRRAGADRHQAAAQITALPQWTPPRGTPVEDARTLPVLPLALLRVDGDLYS